MQYFVSTYFKGIFLEKTSMAFARFPEAHDTQRVRKSFKK